MKKGEKKSKNLIEGDDADGALDELERSDSIRVHPGLVAEQQTQRPTQPQRNKVSKC